MTHFCPTRRSTDLKIRGSIVGPLVADPRASVTARPADGKRLICGRGAARRVQENLAQRRKGAKRKRHAKWHSHVRRGPPQCWKIKDLAARAIFFAPLRLCVFRSEEHTSELQSLMRNSYAVFCLKKKK